MKYRWLASEKMMKAIPRTYGDVSGCRQCATRRDFVSDRIRAAMTGRTFRLSAVADPRSDSHRPRTLTSATLPRPERSAHRVRSAGTGHFGGVPPRPVLSPRRRLEWTECHGWLISEMRGEPDPRESSSPVAGCRRQKMKFANEGNGSGQAGPRPIGSWNPGRQLELVGHFLTREHFGNRPRRRQYQTNSLLVGSLSCDLHSVDPRAFVGPPFARFGRLPTALAECPAARSRNPPRLWRPRRHFGPHGRAVAARGARAQRSAAFSTRADCLQGHGVIVTWPGTIIQWRSSEARLARPGRPGEMAPGRGRTQPIWAATVAPRASSRSAFTWVTSTRL